MNALLDRLLAHLAPSFHPAAPSNANGPSDDTHVANHFERLPPARFAGMRDEAHREANLRFELMLAANRML